MRAAPAPSRGRRGRALGGYFAALLVLLYLPIALLFIFSFSSNTTIAFPLRGLTFDWYAQVLQEQALLDAAWNSLQVALGSSTIATLLGTAIAILIERYDFRAKRLLVSLAVMPLIVPYVVLAVALLILFRAFDVQLSLYTVAIAHVVVSLPFVVLIVLARFAGFDRALEDAAMDLGATYPGALRLVVLPIILPAIISGWMVAFTVSFDEIALAMFLAGRDPTFPVYLAGQIRFTATLPVLIAAAVMLTIGSLLFVLVAERVRRLR